MSRNAQQPSVIHALDHVFSAATTQPPITPQQQLIQQQHQQQHMLLLQQQQRCYAGVTTKAMSPPPSSPLATASASSPPPLSVLSLRQQQTSPSMTVVAATTTTYPLPHQQQPQLYGTSSAIPIVAPSPLLRARRCPSPSSPTSSPTSSPSSFCGCSPLSSPCCSPVPLSLSPSLLGVVGGIGSASGAASSLPPPQRLAAAARLQHVAYRKRSVYDAFGTDDCDEEDSGDESGDDGNLTCAALMLMKMAQASGSGNKRKRQRTSPEQLDMLEQIFQSNAMPNQQTRALLASELGMSARRIQIWFQNKRAKVRRSKAKHEQQLTQPNSSRPAQQQQPLQVQSPPLRPQLQLQLNTPHPQQLQCPPSQDRTLSPSSRSSCGGDSEDSAMSEDSSQDGSATGLQQHSSDGIIVGLGEGAVTPRKFEPVTSAILSACATQELLEVAL